MSLLEQDIARRASDLQGAPATALKTLGAQAELQQLRELRAVNVDLIDGMRDLQTAESEHVALAEERLALLRSRAQLRTIRETDRLDRDPRAVAIAAVISRLGREAIQLYNEAGVTRPKAKADPAQKAFLQLEAGDAIIRSSVRVADLDLIRVDNQLNFFKGLIEDNSTPIPILYEARSEFDGDRARLQSRLAALQADRLMLEGQRELMGAQAASSKDAAVLPVGTVQDLAELLDFQQTDITRLQQRLHEIAAQLDAGIVEREFSGLRERRSLPTNVAHRKLVKHELIRLPQMTVDYWQGILSDLFARLVALTPRSLAGLGASMVVLGGALWWLARSGLARMAMLNPAGNSSVPLEALRRSLPWFMPVAAWAVVALTLGVAERPAWLLAGALALLPLAGFLLKLSDLSFVGASEHGTTRRRLHSLARWSVLAMTAATALGLVVRSVPVLPSVADLVDRAGFGCLLVTAFATWLLRRDLLDSVRDKVAASQPGRVLTAATLVVPGLMVVAAVSGLAGWINLGWAIARGLAAFLIAAGLALLLCESSGISRAACSVATAVRAKRAPRALPRRSRRDIGWRWSRSPSARPGCSPASTSGAPPRRRPSGSSPWPARCRSCSSPSRPWWRPFCASTPNGGPTDRSASRRSASIAASGPC